MAVTPEMPETAGKPTAPATGERETSGMSQSLERGLAILACFTERRALLGISDLARLVDLNKSTTHRYVATLTSLGYLQQDPGTRKYRLGLRVIQLGFAAVNSMEVSRVARPRLQSLADQTGHVASMAVLDGGDVLYIARCRSAREGRYGLDLNIHVGSRLPGYCTSLGKLLLAFEPHERVTRILDSTDLTRRGPNTLTNREALVGALAVTRRTEVGTSDQELTAGVCSIAVPVRDGFGAVVAGVNLTIQSSTWPGSLDAALRKYLPDLRETATAISRRLGYRDDDTA
jgi:IclR family pca regulon transcriptional regulator